MTQSVAMLIETSGIQEYIFASNERPKTSVHQSW